MSKQYDYKTLLDLYLDKQRYFYIPGYGTYYQELIATLENLLETPLEPTHSPEVHHATLWQLFEDLVKRVREGGVGGGYFEGGPRSDLFFLWQDEGIEQAHTILTTLKTAQELEKDTYHLYRTLVYQLFNLFYDPKTQKVFSSEDLLAAGFDDSQEPDLKDYWDWI